jgi:tricorn protease
VFDFASGETKTLAEQADSFVLAADHHTLLLRHGARLQAIRRHAQARRQAGARATKPSRESGHIDLARVRLAVQPLQEWAQIFGEVWRLQRDHFWVEDMSGVDWPAMRERYAPLLPRVATRGELSDLIWELQGELGTSHAYEVGGDHRKPPAVALGHLAAELRPAEQGWQVVSTVQGDAWDARPTRRSTPWACRRSRVNASWPWAGCRWMPPRRRRRCWCNTPAPRWR